MSTDPSLAPSIRANATKLLPESIMQMLILVCTRTALVLATAIAASASAFTNVMLIFFYFTANTSTNSITGSFAKSSEAFAINAAAISPCK